MSSIPVLFEKRELCCGCSACAEICPRKAIQMKEDKEGFLYPHISEEDCIRCEKCISICPIRNIFSTKKFSEDGNSQKVGVATLYFNNNNYGGLAQAYALYEAVASLGYDAELISYKRTVQTKPIAKASLIERIKRNSVSGLLDRYGRKLKEKVERFMGKKYENRLQARAARLEEFRQSIPHSIVYTKETIGSCKEKYHTFISGSDQIWKPGIADEAFVFSFLGDNSGKNVFSYASSVAVEFFPKEYLEFMKRELKKYTAISVREDVTARQFSEQLGYQVCSVVDPTLLLDRIEWEKVTAERQIMEPYIFCYLLGNDQNQRKRAKKMAREQGKILVTIPHIKNGNSFRYRLEDRNFGDRQMFEVGMEEFFSLIKYADCVITDSFHATVFSYIFETPFWVMERTAKSEKTKMNSRIYELTKLLGLENRILRDDVKYSDEIDFTYAKERIEPYIITSKAFLKRALNVKS